MQLLLTNDDGIDAPGLAALEHAARQLGEVVIVAPSGHLSGCGHQVTTSRRIEVHRRSADRYSVDGTPADCVRIALRALHLTPDFILSGVNAGGNLGADAYISGTIAGAREGMLWGVRSIALSHYRRSERDYDWTRVSRWAVGVIRELIAEEFVPGTLWNVNFPHLDADAADPATIRCSLDPSPMPVSFRVDEGGFRYDGNYHRRPRVAGGDVDVCFSGGIAVSLLRPGG